MPLIGDQEVRIFDPFAHQRTVWEEVMAWRGQENKVGKENTHP